MKRITIDEYKEIILEVLLQVDRICRVNNLNYQIAYGTLLGAIRHGGYIPWDDDIDIIMPRADYDKLGEIIHNTETNLSFISIDYNDDTIYQFAKICDKRTIMNEHNFRPVKGYGAYIDVFPMDFASNNESKHAQILKTGWRWRRMIQHSARTGFDKSNSIITNLKRQAAMSILSLLNTQKLIKCREKQLRRMNENETDYYTVMGVNIFPRKWIDDSTDIIFEGKQVRGSIHYDDMLRYMYGEYMQLPPENQRINKHKLECYWLVENNRI